MKNINGDTMFDFETKLKVVCTLDNGREEKMCTDCLSVIECCTCKWRQYIPRKTRKLFGIEDPRAKCLCDENGACMGHGIAGKNAWWDYHLKKNQRNFEVVNVVELTTSE